MEADQSMSAMPAAMPKRRGAHIVLITLSILSIMLLILVILWNWYQAQMNAKISDEMYRALITIDSKVNDINARYDQSVIEEKEEIMEKQLIHTAYTYTDAVYNFRLSFPQQWKGFTTTLNSYGTYSSYAYDSIQFGLQNGESLFSIMVYTPTAYDAIKANPDGPFPAEIKRTDKYVFAAVQSAALTGEYLPEILAQIPQIIATFELIK